MDFARCRRFDFRPGLELGSLASECLCDYQRVWERNNMTPLTVKREPEPNDSFQNHNEILLVLILASDTTGTKFDFFGGETSTRSDLQS